MTPIQPTKENINALVERLAPDYCMQYGSYEECSAAQREAGGQPHYHRTDYDLHIGDISAKLFAMDADSLCDIADKLIGGTEYTEDGFNHLVYELHKLWQPCGFSKSLQEILAGAKWEEVEYHNHGDGHCEQDCFAILPKQPEIRNLFSFLLNLNI